VLVEGDGQAPQSVDPRTGLRRRVATGELGMKTGSGFRSWSGSQPAAVRERVLKQLAAANKDRTE
jgi:3-hydroxyacyl-CoA dehydrogenase